MFHAPVRSFWRVTLPVTLALVLAGGNVASAQTSGQSSPSSTVSPIVSAPTTSAPAREVSIVIAHDQPTGSTIRDLPLGLQRTSVVVTNLTSSALSNQQIVARFGQKPDTLYSVRDGQGNVGIIEGPTGTWFHTISSLDPKESVTFVATWNKTCPGRWKLGARVGETREEQLLQWNGASTFNSGCKNDESISPQPMNLSWPVWLPQAEEPSPPSPPTSAPVTSIPSTTVAPPPVRNSTTVPSTTAPVASSTTAAPAAAPTLTVTTRPPVVSTTRQAPAPSTTVLICRTVKNTRVCSARTTRAGTKRASAVAKKSAPTSTTK